MRQQGDDYAKVHAELLDAEHHIKLLEDEKYRTERDAKEREDALNLKIDDLQDDLKRLSDLLASKQEQLKATDTELIETKKRCDFLMKELARLKGDIASLEDNFKNIQAEKRILQSKIDTCEAQNNAASNEIESLTAVNEKLTRFNNEKAEKEREYTKEIHNLEGHLQSLDLENENLKRSNVAKDKELDGLDEAKARLQHDIDDLKGRCAQYEDQLDERDHKIKDMEGQLSELNNHLTITMSKIESRENHINTLNDKASMTEERAIRYYGEAAKLKHENESLRDLLDKYRNDVKMHKKLREAQIENKYELQT